MQRNELSNNEPTFALHECLTEAELKALVAAAEADSIKMRVAIARNDQISSAAKLRFLAMEIQDAERE